MIDHDTRYLTDTLLLDSNQEIIQLYKKVWPNKNENVWYGYIPKNELAFDNPLLLTYRTVSNYFSKNKYQKHQDEISRYDKCEDSDLEFFAKLVWLTGDYFRCNGFDNPIGVHYNPRLRENVIHPGGSRNQVLNLFAEDKIEALYFNTGGIEPPWLDQMEKQDIADLVINKGWAAGPVPDHGSLIPHFAKTTTWIPVGIKESQCNLHQLLFASSNILKIKCNSKLDFLWKWVVSEDIEHNVQVKVHNKLTDLDQIKITLLICASVNYKDKNFTVTCKNPIN